MSGIARRIMFVHQDKDKVLFHDWSRVITAIGSMVEPRYLVAFAGCGSSGMSATSAAMDFTDDINRVDALEILDIHLEKIKLSDEPDIALHGGQLWKRVGY
jgi:hypothetical protein